MEENKIFFPKHFKQFSGPSKQQNKMKFNNCIHPLHNHFSQTQPYKKPNKSCLTLKEILKDMHGAPLI